jgi:dihydrofolate reductase
MRKVIAALQTSVNGFIEGPNGELDWAMAEDEETWREMDETLGSPCLDY